MSSDRFRSFEEFWPYYIGEHRDPRCRWVHFIGTAGFLTGMGLATVTAPITFVPALGALSTLAWAFFNMDATRSAAPVLLLMIGIAIAGNPAVLGAVVFAYFWAWVGHFIFENNRPATFTYPLWSLAGDLKMFGQMVRGRLWTGDGSEIAGPPAKAAAG